MFCYRRRDGNLQNCNFFFLIFIRKFLILEKGDLQVSDKERQVQSETSFKEVATLIANMCVNPDTKRAYSTAVIEKALRDQHFNLKTNRSAKQHVCIFQTIDFVEEGI